MAQAIKSALPTHLKAHLGDGTEEGGRHHGKTRSHMVSSCNLLISPLP